MIEREKLVALVKKAQEGDNEALNELINECYNGFYYFALKSTGDADKAEEATQDSCLEIISTLKNLREPAAFITWSQRIIYHKCIRHQKPRLEVQVEEDEDGLTIFDRVADEDVSSMPDQVYEDKEFQKTMLNLLNSLPPEQCSALMLYYYDKLSVKEIAEIQGTTEGTIKSRLNYGRKAVKKKVEEYEERTGTKLHAILPLPLLIFSLFEQGAAELPALPAIPALVGSGASATAVAGGVTAAAAQSTATTVATVAASSAGTAVASKVITGIVAGVVAAIVGLTLAGGAIVGGAILIANSIKESSLTTTTNGQNSDGKNDVTTSQNTDNEDPDTSTGDGMHTHDFVFTGENDHNYHTVSCSCGVTQEKLHSYEDGKCPVCEIPNNFSFFTNTDGETCTIARAETLYSIMALPEVINGKRVTGIDDYMFQSSNWDPQENEKITEIILPDSITVIGKYAFDGCENLESINLSDGITEIGEWAFGDCVSLTKITIPKTITAIGWSAFSNCTSLTEVVYTGTVEEWNAIDWDEHTVISAFWNGNVNFIRCSDGDKYENLEYEVNEDAITCSVTKIYNPCKDIIIPSVLDGYRVTRIGSNEVGKSVYYYTNVPIETITIHDGVLEIGDDAFNNFSYLESIRLPDSLTRIGDSAFSGCENLKELSIPMGVTEIEAYAFAGCSSLTEIILPDTITEIAEGLFAGCSSLVEITVPEASTKINDSVFSGCSSLQNLILPEGITEIGSNAFSECSSLTELLIPAKVTKIGECAFYYCTGLTELILPESVREIGNGAFEECDSLTRMEIPYGVTDLNEDLFYGCDNLATLVLPESISYIDSPIWNCYALTTINFKGSVSQWEAIEFAWGWDILTGDFTVNCNDGTIA